MRFRNVVRAVDSLESLFVRPGQSEPWIRTAFTPQMVSTCVILVVSNGRRVFDEYAAVLSTPQEAAGFMLGIYSGVGGFEACYCRVGKGCFFEYTVEHLCERLSIGSAEFASAMSLAKCSGVAWIISYDNINGQILCRCRLRLADSLEPKTSDEIGYSLSLNMTSLCIFGYFTNVFLMSQCYCLYFHLPPPPSKSPPCRSLSSR